MRSIYFIWKTYWLKKKMWHIYWFNLLIYRHKEYTRTNKLYPTSPFLNSDANFFFSLVNSRILAWHIQYAGLTSIKGNLIWSFPIKNFTKPHKIGLHVHFVSVISCRFLDEIIVKCSTHGFICLIIWEFMALCTCHLMPSNLPRDLAKWID